MGMGFIKTAIEVWVCIYIPYEPTNEITYPSSNLS